LSKLGPDEHDNKAEIDRELKIMQGRIRGLGRTSSLEVLTDNGLLPNYAFPERGVRFYGAVYNKHRGATQDHKPVEVIRAAGVALKELAPSNHFYTHSRRYDIQQIAIGNPQQPLVEKWAICGACGHMRLTEELDRPDAEPACPQCGHDNDSSSQLDKGQQRSFIDFSRSQAMSFMEHYESLSSDRTDERDREYYTILRSFDLTKEAPAGAVGEESLPFGIEYRANVVLRDVNVGYQGEPGAVPFGPDQEAPEAGFRICKDCGIAVLAGESPADTVHRRSCRARRRFETAEQKGNKSNPYRWESIYLYRELQSEAIRLLMPVADDEDINTLSGCIQLGLRLRFEGNPAHLIVAPQIMPDPASGMKRYYLTLLDAVPGGTGYLKTLYQEKDSHDRDGEGIMQVMRLAKNALETCSCRKLKVDPNTHDPDGCYRCIRTYRLQYNAESISRERGISLLGKLITAGELRVPQKELAAIKPHSLFGSMLEKKFVDSLKDFVESRYGNWEQTIVRGSEGFRFSLKGSERIWELELQPTLGPAQGVSVQSQPDFLLRSDDDKIKPIAIFTDGFQYHCHPNNRLADDMNKRRAISQSGNYYVWNITWEDLIAKNSNHIMICHNPVAENLQKFANSALMHGKRVPDAKRIVRNGLMQLLAFLEMPHAPGWSQLATFVAFWPLQMLAGRRAVEQSKLSDGLNSWRLGNGIPELDTSDAGEWVHNEKASLNQDLIAYIAVGDALSNRQSQTIILGRLGDSEAEVTGSDYLERWRRFLACMNLYQFAGNFSFWSTSECPIGTAPEIALGAAQEPPDEWADIIAQTTAAIRPYAEEMARNGLPTPEGLPVVEYFNDAIEDDAFAELAWPDCNPPIAVLSGEQVEFAGQWQKTGWKIFTPDELQVSGVTALIDQIMKSI
jgi:DEAD/DEAH box helicase domain-containing protein